MGSLWQEIGAAGAYDKHKYDFQTPSDIAKYMVSLVPPGTSTVLEPTPGRGNIVTELRTREFLVTAPADFFLLDFTARFDCVVMNPPFSAKFTNLQNAPAEFLNKKGMLLGYQILKKCMTLSNNVIALMPWFTLSDSDTRLRQLHNFGIVSVTCLPRKAFDYARIQTVIIEMKKGFTGPAQFKVFSCLQDHRKQILF